MNQTVLSVPKPWRLPNTFLHRSASGPVTTGRGFGLRCPISAVITAQFLAEIG